MATIVKAPPTTAAGPREHPVLVAIADTFIGGMGHPGSPVRAAGEMQRTIDAIPSRADRQMLARVLWLFRNRIGTLVLTGRWQPFDRWSRDRRGALLTRWSTSRLPFRRQLFQVFKRLSLLAFLGGVDADGTNPVWPEIGYPGPITAPPPMRKPIRPLDLEGDTTLTCDAVVVGSGAGGGVMAGELAAAGKNVVVLEQGGYYNEADFNQLEFDMLRKLYLGGGLMATSDAAIGLVAGSCLGGGTVVNYSTSLRTPDWMRKEWADRYGLVAFADGDFSASLDAVCARVNVNTEQSRASAREQVMARGMRALDWKVETVPRNVRGCTQDARCGYCGYGCQIGAKQSTLKTYLEDAYRLRARIIVNCRVERVLIENGRAVGVEATVRQEGQPAWRLRIRSGAVVAAGGALETPALLQRSGLRSPSIGSGLRLHPATAVSGIFDETIRGWEGTMQAIYSDHAGDLDGDHYGAKIYSGPLHPALLALVTPWKRSDHYRTLMRALPQMAVTGIVVRDRGAGRVSSREGTVRVQYRMSPHDIGHLRSGIESGVRILEAAGAREIFTSQSAFVSYRPGQPGGIGAYMEAVDRAGYGVGQMAYMSFHQMGSCRMGIDPAASAIGPDHEAHEVKRLFVTDTSAFPESSGVNPMITAMAMAHRASRFVAAAC